VTAKEWSVAIELARKGLDELGQEYARPQVVDDTGLKALAAEDQLRQGHPENAARTLARVLENRIFCYVELHGDTVVGLVPPIQD
jgi:hypothetical protein